MIYFVATSDNAFVKIGHCKESIDKRFTALQVGNHEELRIVALCFGTRDAEFELHQRFAASRVRGEWFAMTDALAALIAEVGIAEIAQPLVRLNPWVRPETARRIYIACATRGKTQGEIIDEIVAAALPPVPQEAVR